MKRMILSADEVLFGLIAVFVNAVHRFDGW
jgi:hypothetical protein